MSADLAALRAYVTADGKAGGAKQVLQASRRPRPSPSRFKLAAFDRRGSADASGPRAPPLTRPGSPLARPSGRPPPSFAHPPGRWRRAAHGHPLEPEAKVHGASLRLPRAFAFGSPRALDHTALPPPSPLSRPPSGGLARVARLRWPPVRGRRVRARRGPAAPRAAGA